MHGLTHKNRCYDTVDDFAKSVLTDLTKLYVEIQITFNR